MRSNLINLGVISPDNEYNLYKEYTPLPLPKWKEYINGYFNNPIFTPKLKVQLVWRKRNEM